jgi:predicted ArsR family transcriptional regulator
MKLTRHQGTFIRRLSDLYYRGDESIHYSALADHLDVSKITAYDMLRLLEEKGYVNSQYQLAYDKTGSGLTSIVGGIYRLFMSSKTDFAVQTKDVFMQVYKAPRDPNHERRLSL